VIPDQVSGLTCQPPAGLKPPGRRETRRFPEKEHNKNKESPYFALIVAQINNIRPSL
jgi:hypothetical protein